MTEHNRQGPAGTMTAVRWWGRGDVRVDTVPVPHAVPDGWALVAVTACGICGTDIEEYRHGPVVIPIDPHPLTGARAPLTLGHETVGTIVETRGGDGLAPGTPVAVEGNIGCGVCFWCLRGEVHLCERIGTLGQMADGGLAEYLLAPQYMCVPYDPALSPTQAVLTEPLSVAIRALDRAGGVTGKSVAVIGAGTIGLLTVQAARAQGARRIVAVDPAPHRRDTAQELGADATFAPSDSEAAVETLDGRGADIAIESAGNGAAMRLCVELTRRGGVAVILGVTDEEVPLPMLDIMLAEKTVTTSRSHVWNTDFAEAVRMLQAGTIDTDRLVSDVIPLSETVQRGFRSLTENPGDHLKIAVVPDKLLAARVSEEVRAAGS